MNIFKVKFLLHQMRLSIQKEQFTRATIISRKISEKFFDRAGEEVFITPKFSSIFQVELMKLEYYKYMIQIGLHEESYLNVCKHFLCIFKTPKAGEDLQVHLEVFYLIFLVQE